jgi:hypothetical protein
MLQIFCSATLLQMQGDCDYSELVAEDAREEENVYNEIYNTV